MEDIQEILKNYRYQWQKKYSSQEEPRYDDIFSDKFKDDFRDYLKTRITYLSENEMDIFIEECLKQYRNMNFETEFDKKYNDVILSSIKDKVEECIKDLGFDIYGGISIGLIEQPGLNAEQQRVMFTDGSIINISENIYNQSKRFSRLISMSIDIDESMLPSFSFEDSKNIIMNNRSLMDNWCDFYFDNYNKIEHPIFRNDLIIHDQPHHYLSHVLADFMLFYIVAHEYGHHCLNHHLNNEKTPIEKEYEADEFAFKLHLQLVKKNSKEQGPVECLFFLGIILTLFMQDSINKTSTVISGNYEPIVDNWDSEDSDTHPTMGNRINQCFNFVFSTEDIALYLSFNKFIDYIIPLMNFIMKNVNHQFKRVKEEGYTPRGKHPKKNDWLPD